MPQTSETLSIEIKKSIHLNYLKYVPEDCDKSNEKKYPLVIFLHGAGERGNDLEKLKVHGLPKLIDAGVNILADCECIVVSPQCPEDKWWTFLGDELDALITYFINNHNVDTSRIYMTGLSMGGFGTWSYALRRPHALAAAAPICGGVAADKGLGVIKHLPLWVFHGARDNVVPLNKSADAVNILNDMGADIKFTVYPNAEHDSWTATYENPHFYKWLFSHRNSEFSFEPAY